MVNKGLSIPLREKVKTDIIDATIYKLVGLSLASTLHSAQGLSSENAVCDRGPSVFIS